MIKGNKRTRREIILREVPFKTGDQLLLQDLVQKFETGRRQLMNTALFHTVVVAAKSLDGYAVDVMVEVKERWYIFPVPYFKPVDRNLNQWLIEQKASLSRVNYGAKLLYNNVTGRNDKLRFWAMNGYTKQLSFSYDRLYIDSKMKWGMNFSFATGRNKEMNYNTVNNKQVFLKDENFVRSFTNFSIEATYRKAIKTRHRIGFAFSKEQISDTIFKLNPGYFNGARQVISFPELYYSMTYYDLDYIPYPTKGYAAEGGVSKRGLNSLMNVWQATAKGFGSWRLDKNAFVSVGVFGVIKAPFRQPYYNQRMLGYGGMTLQGYEYYVVDGVAAGYLKSTLTRKLFNFNIKIPGGKKREPIRIPFTFYGKVFGNTGYVHNPQPGENFLANKMLYSGGIGIDIFSLYDITFKLEWSFNQLGQNGIFLHRNSIF
jgi:outer membrane protein assembly factor BamA